MRNKSSTMGNVLLIRLQATEWIFFSSCEFLAVVQISDLIGLSMAYRTIPTISGRIKKFTKVIPKLFAVILCLK